MTASCSARSEMTASSNTTRAPCVPRLTLTSRTPESFFRVRSFRAEHDAQCIPPMLKVAVFIALPLRNDDEASFPRRHHPHAAVELVLARLARHEGDQARASGGEQLTNAKAGRQKHQSATDSLAGVDTPLNRNTLFHFKD